MVSSVIDARPRPHGSNARAARRRRAAAALGLMLLGGLLGSSAVPGTADAAVQASSGLHENGSKTVTLQGAWTTRTSKNALGGTFANLNQTGEARVTFRSTGVAWLASRSPYGGTATVYVDGVKKKTVDLYSPTTTHQAVVYRITGLRSSVHTLRVVRTGQRNAASQGRNVTVDAFNVLDTTAPARPSGLVVTAARTGAQLTWPANREADVVGYRVYRSHAGREQQVGSTGAGTRFLDVGLAAATTYGFRVAALDSSGNLSSRSTSVSLTTPRAASPTTRRYAGCPAPTVTVTDRTTLLSALSAAQPGTVIALAPGRYTGPIPVTATGTAAAPVWVCGPRDAVVDSRGVDRNGGVRVDSSRHLVLAGFSVRNSQKGVSVIGSSHVTVADLAVDHVGHEAIHLRGNTVDSTVVGNTIADTGLENPVYGEGVYVGTAMGNWCAYNNCEPDRSDRNVVVGNDIRRTTADQIEAKEGAVDGLIVGNTLDGTGMSSHADSLIVIQSNGWTMHGNVGRNTPLDGIQVWAGFEGYGQDNVAFDNRFSGHMPGYAVRLAFRDLGNYAGCDNTISPDSVAVSNKPCQL